MTGRLPSPVRSALERSIAPGETERPPVPGFAYHAFVVHPEEPGPVTLLGALHLAHMR
jgi:hypothetical protein